MKVFATLSGVKINGVYSFLKPLAPTASDKAPAYVNGDTWLDTVTGFSYILIDDIAGTWEQTETGTDEKINTVKDNLFMSVIRYIGNIFAIDRNCDYINNSADYYADFPVGLPMVNKVGCIKLLTLESVYSRCKFTAVDTDTFTIEPGTNENVYGSIANSFIVGDTIYIQGSRRNDGYYTIAAIDTALNRITVAEPITDETSYAFIYMCKVPEDFIQIVNAMVYYDIITKPTKSGLQSESVGTYSWTAQNLDAMNYPADVISRLDNYKMISVGGSSIFVD